MTTSPLDFLNDWLERSLPQFRVCGYKGFDHTGSERSISFLCVAGL